MSPKKEVVSLTALSYSTLGQYLRSYVRVVSSKSYNLAVIASSHSRSDEVESEKESATDGDLNADGREGSPFSRASSEKSHSLRRISSMRGLKYKPPIEDHFSSNSSSQAVPSDLESCGSFIDNAIEKFHELTFDNLPWYCHQRLAEVFLQVLGETAAACKMLYRRWEEAHLYLHHVQVTILIARFLFSQCNILPLILLI